MSQTYTFTSLQGGYSHTKALSLSWEVNGTSMSDNYDATETDAKELFRLWIKRYYRDEKTQALYGAGAVSIYWSVVGDGVQEAAPFQSHPAFSSNFLEYFSWPLHPETGERLNWLTLPVVEPSWTRDRQDKGGFFRQATGWTPSPLQPAVHLPTIVKAVPSLGATMLPSAP